MLVVAGRVFSVYFCSRCGVDMIADVLVLPGERHVDDTAGRVPGGGPTTHR